MKGNRQDAAPTGMATIELTEANLLKLVQELNVREIELELVLELLNEQFSLEKIENAKRAAELVIANEELAYQNEDKAKRAAELVIANEELAFQNEEKAKRAAELVVVNQELNLSNEEKAVLEEEYIVINEELLSQSKKIEIRAAELVIANEELAYQNEEKAKRAAELVIFSKELAFQIEENTDRVEELSVANEELVFQYKEKTKRAAELIVANKELLFQNNEKADRAKELIVANIELLFQNDEKAKRATELILANKELAFQNEEKAKRADELGITNIELAFQNEEKSKRAEELGIANKELDYQNEELKRSEEALRNSNVFNETLIKTFPFGIDIVDDTGTVLFQSDKFREIFGENAIGGKCWDLYKDDKKQCINCPLTKDLTVGKTETSESHGILGNRIFEINHTAMIYQGKKAILEIFQDITERKQAELELIQAKKQIEEKAAVLNSVIESTSDWIWEINEQGIYCDCSDKVEKILGYTAHEIVGKTPFDFMTEGEIERAGTIFQNKVQACEPIFDLENWNIHKDGHLVCLLTNGVPKFDETGKLTGYIGANKDITDKKNIAHQLEERLKEFQILYNLGQLASEKDITLDALYQRFADILPEGWQYPWITCARIVVDGVEFRTENFEDSGWKLSAPIESNGYLIGLIEVAYLSEMPIAYEGPFIKEERHLIDTLALQLKQIIKRKKAEKALVESEEKLLLLMNSTAEGIYGIDLEGNCTHANKSCIELLGYKTEKDFLGRNMHDLIHHSYSDHRPMKVEECKIFLAFRQGKGTHIDDEVLWRADGTSFPVEYYSYPIFKNEQIVGAVLTFTDITERRKAEEENVLQLALINSLLDSIPDVIFFKDTEGVYLGCNPAFNTFVGKSRNEIIGKTDYDLFEKAIADTFRQFDQEMLVKKLYQHNEEWVTYPDGSNVLLDTLKTPYWGGDGILIGVLGISRDITERKKGEDALRKSEENFKAIANYSASWEGWFNPVGKLIWMNPYSFELTGYTPEEYMASEDFLSMFCSPEDLEMISGKFTGALKGSSGANLEARALRKDGSTFWVSISWRPILDANGESIGFRTSTQDITERKRLEEEKRITDTTIRILSLAINQSPVTVIITDLAGNIESVNPRFTEDTGYTAEEVIGQNPRILKEGDRPDSDYKELWDTILSGKNWHGIFHNRKKNGELYRESAVISPVKDQYGTITHFLAVMEDITSRLKSEQEIKLKNEELQRLNSEKNKFFSIIAHDLRGPMGGFAALTELMADENEDFTGNEIKEMTADLSRSARNTFNLLENLLEWSQMDRGLIEFKPQTLDLIDVVTECANIIAELAQKKRIALIVNIQNGLEVIADRNMLQTVIRNLLSNAIKFTPKGGEVIFSARASEDNRTVMSVRDTGIGMSDDMRNNLFITSANTKRPGTDGEHSTGLGLLLCKEFVEKHGGLISVESEQDKGTVISFTISSDGVLPEKYVPEQVVNTDDALKKIDNLKILIAEDDEISAKLTSVMVKGFSREVFRAKTGNSAVEICRNNPDIDLILMDISMPDLDGFEATRQIRQFNQEVIIFAQTTFILLADREKSFEVGCNDYISKPINKVELLDLIQKYFKKN